MVTEMVSALTSTNPEQRAIATILWSNSQDFEGVDNGGRPVTWEDKVWDVASGVTEGTEGAAEPQEGVISVFGHLFFPPDGGDSTATPPIDVVLLRPEASDGRRDDHLIRPLPWMKRSSWVRERVCSSRV